MPAHLAILVLFLICMSAEAKPQDSTATSQPSGLGLGGTSQPSSTTDVTRKAKKAKSLKPSKKAARAKAKAKAKKDAERQERESQAKLQEEEAIARLRTVLEKRPLHGQAFSSLVKHYVDQGRLQDLVKEYEQRMDALPDSLPVRLVLARVYLRAAKPQKAAELIKSLDLPETASADDRSKFLVFKSEVFQQTGRTEAAIAMLDEARKQAKTLSDRFKLADAMADLYLRDGKRDKAASTLTELSKEFADNYLHRKRIADGLAQRDLFDEAVNEYQGILKLVAGENDKRCEVLRQMGKCLERLDRREEAIDAYCKAVELLSAGHWLQRELHDRIVTLYRASGRLEDLVKYCRTQVERTPEQTGIRILLADVLMAAQDAEGAKQALEEAVTLFPKDPVLSERRVQLLQRLDDAVGVSSEYERIISQHPKDVELYIAFGQFLAANRQLEAARNQWKHVLNSGITDAALANRLGGLFEPYDLDEDAIECYEQSIKLAPREPEGYTALARLWFYRGEKTKAVEVLQRIASANPDDASLHASRCQSLLNLGMNDEALEAITRACEIDEKDVAHQFTRADVLLQLGQVGEALKVRRETLDLIQNPGQQALAMDVLVSMYASSGQLESLLDSESKKLEADPDDLMSLMILSRAADFDRKFADARAYLARVLKIQPVHEQAMQQMARLHEAVGDIDEAVAVYQKLGETHPVRARQYYQAIADLKLRYNDRAGAIEVFDRMVQASPGNASVLKTVAEQLARMDEIEKAVSLYEQSLKIRPNAPEAQLDYGKALEEAGRLEDALASYKTAALQRTDREVALEAMTKLHETASQLGSVEDILQEFQTRVEADPDDTQTARMLAELLIREFEYDRAMDVLDLVLRHHPRDAEVQLVRGEVLRRLARFDDAVDAYRGVVRLPNVDRDFALGELGKAYCESGRIDQARDVWRQIDHKLYAGSLMKNNGLLDDAVEVLREGIRLKPDDFGLHRNLVITLQAAGKVDESLAAAKRLLDLEPDNIFNIQQVAEACLDRGDRAGAAEIAARLFSSAVTEKKDKKSGGAGRMSSMGGAPVWMMSLQSAWSWSSGGSPRSNLDRGITFFTENGLLAELEEVLKAQLKAQPDNALLKQRAADLFAEQFGKPEFSLSLLKELETAEFPLEHQDWLGQCSQRDHMRVRQYQLIGSKPGLRDQRLKVLDADKGALSRDEQLELAVIRQSQGATDEAVELLKKSVSSNPDDVVALSILVDTLARAERFEAAEPHVDALVDLLARQREQVRDEMIERVRRDFVRTLPVQFQLRVSEEMLRDIADKWTLGQSMLSDFTGFAQVMGYFRARLTQATIYAKTDRIEKAREIWKQLEPRREADADAWTMLAGITQMHDQNDLAYTYYSKALKAASILAADPLMQQIYGGSLNSTWYGQGNVIDSAFNKIVEAFAGQDRLVELYDFLRETEQSGKARRVAEQYKLYDDLKKTFRERLDSARETFLRGGDDVFNGSVPYFMHTCKLAEICDQTGDWPKAEKTYEQYLTDFPDELGLLLTLGEVAEAQEEYAKAIEWQKKALQAKERLARKARDWVLRTIYMTPAPPQVLSSTQQDSWEWQIRWGRNTWWYGSRQNPLERWPSWMRIAQLYLSLDNVIASGDAMERALGLAGGDRKQVGDQILAIVQERQLTKKMLPVLRSLAVQLPTEERVQLAFAESLEANNREALAAEVYRRMLRRGLAGLGSLARVRDKLKTLEPKAAQQAIDTLETLQASVDRDPDNAKERLRLAKAFFYSMRLDDSLKMLAVVQEKAPHLEGLHDLLIEIYTINGDMDKLIEAIRTKIKRTKDDEEKRKTRRRLVEELLSVGRTDEALEELKDVVDPRDPSSYERVGFLLHYFGRHDEAVKQFELSGKSHSGNMWGSDDPSKKAIARALVLKGDLNAATEKILEAVQEGARKATQFAGMAGLYSAFDQQQNYFESFVPLFVIRPKLLDEVEARLVKQHEENPEDPQPAKLLMQLYDRLGRADKSEKILDKLTSKGASDQTLAARIIDKAIERREYARAIELATKWIEQQPKPQMPPGIPAQFAGMYLMMSPRNTMICKLGDVYWKSGDKDKAFEAYRRIVDEKLDETQIAYAAICSLRGREAEAKKIVEETLEKQKVKSPALLQFRALLAIVDNQLEQAFDCLEDAAELGDAQSAGPFGYDSGDGGGLAQLSAFASRTGLIERFAEFARKRISKNPNDWESHSALANLYYQEGRTEDAFTVLDEAAKIKSLRQQVLQQRVQWLEGLAVPDQLIAAYGELIEASEKKVKSGSSNRMSFFGGSSEPQTTNTEKLRERLGDLLWQSADKDAAEKVWTERMNLKKASSRIALASRFENREDFDRAEAEYRAAIKLEPDNSEAHGKLVELAFHKKDYGESLDHLREVFQRRYVPKKNREEQNDPYNFIPRRRYGVPSDQGEDYSSYAAELARIPEIAARLNKPADTDATDAKLAVAVLCGSWQDAEPILRQRLDDTPYEPMVWKLWTIVNERKGDWAEAARAKDYVRRLERTSLPRHRDELALVLAGKHIKEAAAGVKQSMMSRLASGRQSPSYQSSYYFDNYYGGPEDGVEELALLYVKLKQFDKAEHLYLIGSDSSAAQTLPAIASLMWSQDEKDRATELLELASILSDSGDSVVQYAGVLADRGRANEASELLIRQYRCIRDQNINSSPFAAMYAIFNNSGRENQFEDYQEQNCSRTLHDVLRRGRLLDETLTELRKEATANPDDKRLSKLVLSLLIRDRRWTEAREALTAWRASRPTDETILTELLHACMQLEEWKDALEVISSLKKESPEAAEKMRLCEAFLRLMQDDKDACLSLIDEHLKRSAAQELDSWSEQLTSLLVAMHEYDRLVSFLEGCNRRGKLTDPAGSVLCRLYMRSSRWSDAAELALEKLWQDSAALDENSPWYLALRTILEQAKLAGAETKLEPDRREDRAMLAIVERGPDAGVEAFAAAVDADSANDRARRGLVFASLLAGNIEAAVRTNEDFVSWLAERRHQVWQRPPAPSISDSTGEWVKSMQARDLDASGILGLTMSFSSLLQQVIQPGGRQNNMPGPRFYEELWKSHEQLQLTLLCRSNDPEAVTRRLQLQERYAKAEAQTAGSGNSGSYRTISVMGGTTTYYYNDPFGGNNPAQTTFDADWRSADHDMLLKYRSFEPLIESLESLGSRISPDMQYPLSEAYAAVGKEAEARKWRDKAVDELVMKLRKEQTNTSNRNSNSYNWRWYSYNRMGDQIANTIRSAMFFTLPEKDEESDDNALTSELVGPPNELWRFAMIDPEARDRLLSLAAQIGPGWEASNTIRQLIAFHKAKREPTQIITLIEKASTGEDLLKSPLLTDYFRSCFEIGDFDRIERLLLLIEPMGAQIENDAKLMRLMLLAHQGRATEADALESELLANCRMEAPTKLRPDEALLEPLGSRGFRNIQRSYSSMSYSGMYFPMMFPQRSFLPGGSGIRNAFTISALATTLGVRFDPQVRPEDVTVDEIREAYARHRLFDRAAHIVNASIERLKEDAAASERMALLSTKADYLTRSGQTAEGREIAGQVEQYWQEEARNSPLAANPYLKLEGLYNTKAMGRDKERAYAAFCEARRRDPSIDPAGLKEAGYLFKLKKYDDAWRLYSGIIARGELNDLARNRSRQMNFSVPSLVSSNMTMFQAGISAHHAGEKLAAASLLRQAIWRSPNHKLAKEAGELLE
ncbi:MAG: tetratricopeptide repeat protein [Planctomycetia bacterium]|nr:tetratricopeptide repeat protein [Planctomycetia bacterium]MCC7315878.1 tetratricopeptide repeat protein [Planctomycetota bacterium]